jgi:dynein heavy chain
MIGEINYGGRVTDTQDLRLLNQTLLIYMKPDLFQLGYKFSESGLYYLPQTHSLEDMRAYIDSLPEHDEPEIFGLHENSLFSLQRNESDIILTIAMRMPPIDLKI